MIHFGFPWAFLLLLILPFWVRAILKRRHYIGYPSLSIIQKIPRHWTEITEYIPLFLRVLLLTLLIIGLARPQTPQKEGVQQSEGIDIVLVVDTSRSMEARDFVLNGARPNRLEVVKNVLFEFIKERPSDRMGLVIFGSEAFTQAPLTLDHQILLKFLDRVRIGMAGDATAIGDGLATAINRLRDLESKSRVVILLTDGANTFGRIDPLVALEAAVDKKVTVYTIGVGTTRAQGGSGNPGFELDEKLLRTLAEKTGGKYFLATDTETLRSVYEQIDRLEKSKAKIKSFRLYEELFPRFLWLALGILFIEVIFFLSRWRSIP